MKMNQVRNSATYIKERVKNKPAVGLILGSGLGILVDEIQDAITIPYHEIPDFPVSTVEGHAGSLVFGTLNGVEVVAMAGRFHYYEGYDMKKVTFPVRVMKELGVETLIVTNAAGGVNTAFEPGDLMIISDHINFIGDNPLIGKNDASVGPRFLDMSQAYCPKLRAMAKEVGKELSISLQEGVYVAMSGPTYETPAEIRMVRIIGGDAVGMSTVPEVMVARHSGMSVLGISCISNMAAGILDQPLDHEEVIETTQKVKTQFLSLVKEIVKKLA
ncbi:MAG: purine-nucleoside phosphorylase [Bacillaceae bacterium]